MSQETDETLVRVEPDTTPEACVIWLHGLGADGFDFKPIIPYLKLPKTSAVRFLFPHAEVMPVTVNGGAPMPAWYDILEMNVGRKVDKPALIASSERIKRLIDEQVAEGIPADKIILAGFSQGGAVAYHTALTYPEPLAGLIALSTYMATADEIKEQRPSAAHALPIWVGHGTKDDVVQLTLGEQAMVALNEMNLSASWTTYPMGHEVIMEEIEALGCWMAQQLAL
jgi:phospholipase/carboxylesterase